MNFFANFFIDFFWQVYTNSFASYVVVRFFVFNWPLSVFFLCSLFVIWKLITINTILIRFNQYNGTLSLTFTIFLYMHMFENMYGGLYFRLFCCSLNNFYIPAISSIKLYDCNTCTTISFFIFIQVSRHLCPI